MSIGLRPENRVENVPLVFRTARLYSVGVARRRALWSAALAARSEVRAAAKKRGISHDVIENKIVKNSLWEYPTIPMKTKVLKSTLGEYPTIFLILKDLL